MLIDFARNAVLFDGDSGHCLTPTPRARRWTAFELHVRAREDDATFLFSPER